MRQALGPGALGKPRGSGWRGRLEGGSGWGTHVNPWLFHSNVWQNSLQIKKKEEEKKRNSNLTTKKSNLYRLTKWGSDCRRACMSGSEVKTWSCGQRETLGNIIHLGLEIWDWHLTYLGLLMPPIICFALSLWILIVICWKRQKLKIIRVQWFYFPFFFLSLPSFDQLILYHLP